MNGTIYDEIKKNDNSKKKEKLKFFMAIISTNLLVLILSLSFGHREASPISPQTPIKLTHKNYKMIVVPLTLLIELDLNAPEIPITLLSKDKKVLITKAYLHEEIKSKSNEPEATARFKIEIPDEEVIRLSSDSFEQMVAIPKIEMKPKNPLLKLKRVSQYEIDL